MEKHAVARSIVVEPAMRQLVAAHPGILLDLPVRFFLGLHLGVMEHQVQLLLRCILGQTVIVREHNGVVCKVCLKR